MQYDYVCLAPGFAKEALEAYDAWEDKDEVPRKVQELMMVLRVEVSRLYKPPPEPVPPKIPIFKDARLG